jgi:uncharacterized membrane protein HdeD (DUF308 family)
MAMKSCPTCNRTYPDDTLAFCLMDGAVLSAPYDPSDTQRRPAPRGSNAPSTEVLSPPITPVETGPPLESTIRAPAPQVSPLYSDKKTYYSQDKQSSAPGLLRWALVLRGLTAIAFGVWTFVWPRIMPFITLWDYVFLFGAYALVHSAFAIIGGIRFYVEHKRGWLMLLDGILSVGVGAIAVVAHNFVFMFTLIPAWAIATGVFEIGAAIQLRKYVTGKWLLALAGVGSVLFGFALLINTDLKMPEVHSSADVRGILDLRDMGLVWLFRAYWMVFGVLLLAFGLRLRSHFKNFTIKG